MITIENVEDFPARARGAYVTVGNFDGVHRGHQRLIGRLRARADAAGVPALAVTFDPHPVALLRPDKAPVPLVWPEREIALLEEAGATEVAAFRTGRWLLDLTAREFFDRVIRRQFAARGMVEGPNFAFGHDRQGNVEILGGWCAAAGIEFEVVEPISDHGQLISSSRIRQSLHEGKVEEASRFLGRPHRIRGVVTHGAGRGAGLGIPTINLDGIDTLIPLDGVYAARVFVPGAESQPGAWAAACNIGPNPTFGEQIRKVEAHLIGFAGDLYGRSVELDFLARLRSTRAFANLDDLLSQIRSDIERTRQICDIAWSVKHVYLPPLELQRHILSPLDLRIGRTIPLGCLARYHAQSKLNLAGEFRPLSSLYPHGVESCPTMTMSSSVTIGSRPDCDLVVNVPSVSGHHCRLTRDETGFVLEDLNSTNGTFVNGERIRGAVRVRLTATDTIHLGSHALSAERLLSLIDRQPAPAISFRGAENASFAPIIPLSPWR